uniref:AlNc14C145G7380 protein n=1 Tax=Albugo laibachii Nc14 TaxID=890382 RepID=F0WLJ3_9STRA|nr:AlNc14C145G7380 [Albugo laibachii Nc14]|eukprot:CCA22156.1 AlNc14C145G7380 [Albugo laibachii Nc14]
MNYDISFETEERQERALLRRIPIGVRDNRRSSGLQILYSFFPDWECCDRNPQKINENYSPESSEVID